MSRNKVYSEKEITDARSTAIEIAYGRNGDQAKVYMKNGLKAIINQSDDPRELLLAATLFRIIDTELEDWPWRK